MVSGKGINKQWNDIWIENDGIHMLKLAFDSLFKSKKESIPSYLDENYIISFDNIKKIQKMYYKGRRVMLVTLKDTDVQFEVTVKNFNDYRIIKQNLLTKTVGTKRKFALAFVLTIIIVLLCDVDYRKLKDDVVQAALHIDLTDTNFKMK